MEPDGGPGLRQPLEPSPLQARIKTVRAVFQVLGAVVCVFFALRGVVIFTDDSRVEDFWDGCRWASEGVLCISIGLGGCLLESRALFASVRQHLSSFAINRLAIAVVYIWIGCYSSGRIQASQTWTTLNRVVGVIAWLVGAVDLLTSCCSDRSERVDNAPLTPSGSQGASGAASRYTTASEPSPGALEDPGSSNPFGDDDPSEQPVTVVADIGGGAGPGARNPFGVESPPGGWATVGSKPFGTS